LYGLLTPTPLPVTPASPARAPPRSSKRNQDNQTSLLKIQGVEDSKDVDFYTGKRVVYIYKAKSLKNGTKFRAIWGRVSRPHGTNGVVKAKFRHNLPGKSLGAPVRVMLYPSRV
jgi:large subunit ribosomal protein L35Ae